MGILDFFNDYGIGTSPDNHKHHREGWINIECPFCTGTSGYHLGFNLSDHYFYCWRCGAHSVADTVMKLLGIKYYQASQIIIKYRLSANGKKQISRNTNSSIKIKRKAFKFPTGVTKMEKVHHEYLRKRGFDSSYLEKKYGLMGTSWYSVLDGIPYGFRILIPIYWGGQIVSFQCRDYTGKQEKKYMACPQDRERIPHKNILYEGPTEPITSRRKLGICVEGAFDVWKIGEPAFASLGTGYTRQQIRLIAGLYESIVIIFDPEKIAQQRAKELAAELRFHGVNTTVYNQLSTDPGDMTLDQVKKLKDEIKITQGAF